MYRQSEVLWQKAGREGLRCWKCGSEFEREVRRGSKPACQDCCALIRETRALARPARTIVRGPHGGGRPVKDELDGRLHPKRLIEADTSSHHLVAPGAWMPFARADVEDDPFFPSSIEGTGKAFPWFNDEDLSPGELRWIHKIRAFAEDERRRLLGS